MKKIMLALAAFALAIVAAPLAARRTSAGQGQEKAQRPRSRSWSERLPRQPRSSRAARAAGSARCRDGLVASHRLLSRPNLRVPGDPRPPARGDEPDTLFVSAGDLIGATPLSRRSSTTSRDRGVQPDGSRLQRRRQP